MWGFKVQLTLEFFLFLLQLSFSLWLWARKRKHQNNNSLSRPPLRLAVGSLWGGGGHSSRTCPQFFLSLFEGCAVTSVSENKLIGWQGRQSGRGSRCLIQIHVMKNVFQVQQHGVCSNLMIFLHVTDFYKQGFLIWLYSLKTKTSVCVCVCVHLTSSVTLICDSAAKWCHWLVCSFPVSSTLVTYKNPTYLKYFRGEKDPTQTLHPPPTTELKLVANY